MEVNLHLRSADVGSAYLGRLNSRETRTAEAQVAFENSQALRTALQNTPDTREDVVRRATELVGDVNYPPEETIQMISNLLAIQMQSDGDPV